MDDPQIVTVPRRQIAYIALDVPRDDMRTVMGPAHDELTGAVKAAGVTPDGPWFTHHLRIEADAFHFQICLPVSTPVPATGRVRSGELGAKTAARTVYHGPYEGLGDAWEAFVDWMVAHEHVPAPDLFETYVTGPGDDDDPAAWRTELVRPLLAP